MAAQMDENGLRQLVEYLKNSLSGHDRNKQKEAELVSRSHFLRQLAATPANPFFSRRCS